VTKFDNIFIQVMQPFKNILDYINIYATDQQPNKLFKFLRSHSLDITSYATKLPEKEKKVKCKISPKCPPPPNILCLTHMLHFLFALPHSNAAKEMT